MLDIRIDDPKAALFIGVGFGVGFGLVTSLFAKNMYNHSILHTWLDEE